jgi:plasmid maintenance system killer protein
MTWLGQTTTNTSIPSFRNAQFFYAKDFNDQYWIYFEWSESDAKEVEIVDYH